MANLALETETRELGVPAGLQDRVVQVYEGLVYMDFDKALMDRQGYGNYEPLDPAQLPQVYLAYRTSLSEGTEVFHANVRERWLRGDPEVVEAMRTWASYAERGRAAMQAGDYEPWISSSTPTSICVPSYTTSTKATCGWSRPRAGWAQPRISPARAGRS